VPVFGAKDLSEYQRAERNEPHDAVVDELRGNWRGRHFQRNQQALFRVSVSIASNPQAKHVLSRFDLLKSVS
jgi:hypothetical protein